MRTHFKRVVKRNSRPLTARQQAQNAEDNAPLGPLFGRPAPEAEPVSVPKNLTELRYRQLDELQRDWAIAAGRLPEMVGRSMYRSIVTLALLGKGGKTIKVDMRTGRVWWTHNWFFDGEGNVFELGTLPMTGAELIEALRIATETN